MFAKDSISTENLNDLPFPSGYVFTDGTEQIVVTGQKTFQNVLGMHMLRFRQCSDFVYKNMCCLCYAHHCFCLVFASETIFILFLIHSHRNALLSWNSKWCSTVENCNANRLTIHSWYNNISTSRNYECIECRFVGRAYHLYSVVAE